MTRKMRCGVLAAASAVAFFVVCSSAMAAVALNGGPITLTATARSPVLTESTGTAITINCVGSTIRGNVLTDGRGTIAAGDATFANCVIAGSGSVTFHHLGDWDITTEFLLDPRTGEIIGVAATLTLPSGSARLSSGSCSFELVGTSISLQGLVPTEPPELVSISTLPFASTTLGLRVENASNCGADIADGDLARFNAVYTLSSTLTGTLVPD
jgi:hypothetical protein